MKTLFINRITVSWQWIFDKIPNSMSWIFWFPSLLLKYFRFLRIDSWQLSGNEIHTGKSIIIEYSGIPENKNYFARLAFAEVWSEKYQGKKWLWQIVRGLNNDRSGSELTSTEVPRTLRFFFLNKHRFYIPAWIDGEVKIPDDIDSFVKKNSSLSNILRRIRKFQYRCETMSGSTIFDYFYYNMYVPYISKAHGDRAFIEKYVYLKKKYGKCDLVMVKRDQTNISGNLITRSGEKARLLKVGIKDGNTDFVKDGAIDVLYYFAFIHLQKMGCKYVNLGGSRGFLNDGLFQYKKRWDPKIMDSTEKGFMLGVRSITNGVKGFLLNNPFIFKEQQELKEALFIDGEQISQKEIQDMYKTFFIFGISELCFYSLSDRAINRQVIPPELSCKILDVPFFNKI